MKPDANLTSEPSRYLAFTLSSERYGIPLLKVKEVIALPQITPVPQTPSHFKGIMNLRGRVISIIDLRLKLKMGKSDSQGDTSVIILDLAPHSLGVIVDSIDCVVPFRADEIQPAPDLESQVSTEYITGVATYENKLVLLLDIARTLSLEDLRAIQSQNLKSA